MNVFWWIVGAALIIKLVVWLTEYLNGETNDNAEARETERQERIAALRETLSSRIAEVVSEHLPTLRKKQQQCLYYDDYGVLCGTDDWAREQKYFKDNVLVRDSIIDTTVALVLKENLARIVAEKSLPELDLVLEQGFDRLQDFINNKIAETPIAPHINVDVISGIEFEAHCAETLEQFGWSVIRKGGSGDQGVDLIASLGQLRVAIQCKRYSQPVGNKAVQEVAAGQRFEQCNLAVVVSNADYTPAARQLANALGVLLLHYADLEGFRDQVQSLFPALVSGEGRK